jgi:uncharacterized membrane protein
MTKHHRRELDTASTTLHNLVDTTMKPYIAVPAITALVYRAWSRKSLTPVGIATALVVAVIHAIHPWSVFFALLAVFFLAGTTVTKVRDVRQLASSY